MSPPRSTVPNLLTVAAVSNVLSDDGLDASAVAWLAQLGLMALLLPAPVTASAEVLVTALRSLEPSAADFRHRWEGATTDALRMAHR